MKDIVYLMLILILVNFGMIFAAPIIPDLSFGVIPNLSGMGAKAGGLIVTDSYMLSTYWNVNELSYGPSHLKQ